jgi:mannose-6-phosphate isomerase-like protein (cupin superfamily)
MQPNLNKEELKKKCEEKNLDYNEQKPWGSYYNLYESTNIKTIQTNGKKVKGPTEKVKLIFVNPHEELSMQKHFLRSEIWRAETDGVKLKLGPSLDKLAIIKLKPNEEIEIPKEAWHQLFNDTDKEIIIHEIQLGICNEDDIIRHKDKYKRDFNDRSR